MGLNPTAGIRKLRLKRARLFKYPERRSGMVKSRDNTYLPEKLLPLSFLLADADNVDTARFNINDVPA